MINLGLEGKQEEAYKLHYSMIDIVGYIFEENNPAGIKAVLANLGLCKTNVRLPLVEASKGLSDKINTFLKHFNS